MRQARTCGRDRIPARLQVLQNSLRGKNGTWLVTFRKLEWSFCMQDCHSARQDIHEFLTANLLSMYVITSDTDWSWIKNRSLSSQRRSQYGFQILHSIWNAINKLHSILPFQTAKSARFGCKPWLQSIQNHARSRFQAFKHRHLKCLCRLIGIWLIWADAHFSDRSSISICCFAQDSIRNMLICSYALFSLINMNDRKIERRDERGFGW